MQKTRHGVRSTTTYELSVGKAHPRRCHSSMAQQDPTGSSQSRPPSRYAPPHSSSPTPSLPPNHRAAVAAPPLPPTLVGTQRGRDGTAGGGADTPPRRRVPGRGSTCVGARWVAASAAAAPAGHDGPQRVGPLRGRPARRRCRGCASEKERKRAVMIRRGCSRAGRRIHRLCGAAGRPLPRSTWGTNERIADRVRNLPKVPITRP